MKKVLVIILCLIVVVSTLCLSASAYGGASFISIYNNPFGFNVDYNGTAPNGSYIGYDNFYTYPIPVDSNSFVYSSNYFDYYYLFTDDSHSAFKIRGVLTDDSHVNELYFGFKPIYFYTYEGGTNYELIFEDYLSSLSFTIDNVAVDSGYYISANITSPFGISSVEIDDGNFIGSHTVDFGYIVYDYLLNSFNLDDPYMPLKVELFLVVDGIDLQEDDGYEIGMFFDDEYVGFASEYYSVLDYINYDSGFSDGYDVGVDNGYDVGYDTGYNVGYNAGQGSQLNGLGLGEFLSTSVGSFLDANIFGSISIGDIMLTVIGIVLTLMFLKFFAGG